MITANPDGSPFVKVPGAPGVCAFLLRQLDKHAVLPILLATRVSVRELQMF
jgi:hypothetical protein